MKFLNLLVSTPLSDALGWSLLHSLWQGALVAMCLAVLLAFVRSAQVRYAAAYGALLLMLISLAVTRNENSVPIFECG